MSAPKRESPYMRLRRIGVEWINEVRYARIISLWTYPKAKLREGWGLADLYERIMAADKLGYDVILRATDAGIEAKYRKRPSDAPWEFSK